jgi:trk system potassium uptake protein TrkA
MSAPKKFHDKEVKDIKLPAKAIIGALKRGNKILIPKGNTLIRENDDILIFTTSEDAVKLKEFFKK